MNQIIIDPLVQAQAAVDKAAASLQGDLDQEQIQLYELAFSQAELDACQAYSRAAAEQGGTLRARLLEYLVADTVTTISGRFSRSPGAYGLELTDLPDCTPYQAVLDPKNVTELGQLLLEEGLPDVGKLNEEHRLMASTFGQFADEVVAPLAEEIHREDQIIPDAILNPLREMGCFGLSVPQRFGGLQPDDAEDSVGMVIVTEELSRGSLGAAGSLITRPEIMARAIMEGGTDEQKQAWLPQLAAGDPLCAISVTEPNTGSDVANVALKATQVEGGWLLNGAKTWCTFAGKAGLILVLARTNPEAKPAHKGLSLFVVEKPSTDDHAFEVVQESGGRMTGRAISTLGYRGMHSFEMFYDDFFVPHSHLIGSDAGMGRGFYYTMRGFMGGRLQTAARACGVMRAAYDSAVAYTTQREVFGKPVANYPVSAAKLVRSAALIGACKALTLEVAQLMDEGHGAMEASLVKLVSCRAAEWVTREALQLYGGMGYAEETPVSRYFVDARVLSIFEGAEETLAIRVIGKSLIDRQRQGA